MTPKGPLGAVHVRPPQHSERGPQDLTRPTPPPDPTTGLTPDETEEAMRPETQPSNLPAGVIQHPMHHQGRDRCGALRGRCFGDIINGVCAKCGHNYRHTTVNGGVNTVGDHGHGVTLTR